MAQLYPTSMMVASGARAVKAARTVIALGAFALIAAPLPAAADEVEDMLIRLLAAGTPSSPTTGVTGVNSTNGVIGAIVASSGNGSQGIMALNQDASIGGANQANIVVVAVSHGLNASALARLLGQQVYQETPPTATEVIPGQPVIAALAIVDSYKGGTGIAQVNQNAGVGNSQRNATLIAAALGGGDASAMTEADLSDQGSLNRAAGASGTPRGIASVAGSFTDFSGIVQVNQTIGSGNLVSNTVTMTYAGPAGGGG